MNIYTPLNTSRYEIRVVDLHPGEPDDPIHCSLKKVSLENGADYIALSYVWGDDKNTRPIQVNGNTLNITFNLALALKRLRDRQCTFTLWIDAICINQKNVVERTEQVGIMRYIYPMATCVWVWIGDPSSDPSKEPMRIPTRISLGAQLSGFLDVEETDIDASLDTVKSVRSQAVLGECSLTESDDTLLGLLEFMLLLIKGTHLDAIPWVSASKDSHSATHPRSKILAELVSMGSMPWWRRLWVIQEFILARDMMIIYKSIALKWTLLHTAMANLSKHQSCCAECYFALGQNVTDSMFAVLNMHEYRQHWYVNLICTSRADCPSPLQ
jgi:hypothetical protein